MLVKCRKCGNKIDRTIAFKIVVGGKNAYYCNEEEYKQCLEEQKLKAERKQQAKEKRELLNKKKEEEKILREKIYDNVKYVFGYLPVNTALYKEMNELFKTFEYEIILRYLEQEKDYLWDTLRTKEFCSEYAKIRYSLYKEMNELFKTFEYEIILRYLEQEKDYLWDTLRTKEFCSEYAKIRYFSAILKNSMADFESKYQLENPEPIKNYDEDFCEMKYRRKTKKRSLSEIENNV